MKLRYEEMTPAELVAALEARAVAYMPCGLLEWHGDHLPLGTDGLKAHAICLKAAERTGGVVLPVNWIGTHGFDLFTGGLVYERETVKRVMLATLGQLEKVGARVVVLLTGHYGEKQVALVKEVATEFMRASGVKVIAQPEYEGVVDERDEVPADHAGKWETSFMLLFRPELVQMDAFKTGEAFVECYDCEDTGEDAEFHAMQRKPWLWNEDLNAQSSPERAAAVVERIVRRLAGLVQKALGG
ncbi:MAG: creatininase family protein [Verrucomicrobia bacterium]|nr:creatininase family protein [Verrucomicrobiota bacterium]